jgi:hypothetical protein
MNGGNEIEFERKYEEAHIICVSFQIHWNPDSVQEKNAMTTLVGSIALISRQFQIMYYSFQIL